MFEREQTFFSERLNRLIDKALSSQWNSNQEINWSLNVEIPAAIPAAAYIDMVSQLYYAEEAALSILGKMLQTIPDFQGKQFLGTQAVDETRHARVYRGYLEKLGDIAPINEGLQAVLERGLSWSGSYCGNVVAVNVVMEGEALLQQRKRIETLPCPLFRQMNEAIIRDESRHAAFGHIYMGEKLKRLDIEERMEIYRWIKELWLLWTKANEGRYIVSGADVLRTEKDEFKKREHKLYEVFVEIGLVRKDEVTDIVH